jgi:membrane protein implicated in regulation of membrane protease activity
MRTRHPAPALPWDGHARGRPAAPAVAARAAARAAAGYGRWVARAPETRGLGTALAALYPAGEIGCLAHADPLMLAGFAPPAALAAWTGTWKTHRSRRYSAAAAALAAGIPAWLAAAAATGVTSLPVLLGYTAAASAGWSAITWSDVMRHRRALKAQRARWETIARAAGLEGSRLVREEDTRTGQAFTVDIRGTGATARALARGNLAEHVAAALALPAERVRAVPDPRHAGNLLLTVQTADPWAAPVPHPALGPGHAPAPRSVTAAPFSLGTVPDTGSPLELTVYDDQGAWHTNIAAASGGGKTTLYNNVLEQATARNDILVWPIDLRKGTIPWFWHPALDYWAGLSPDGEPEHDKALAILAWGAAIIKIRSARNGGRNHVPSPSDPAILIVIDEGDALLGADSPIAHKAKPLAGEILKGGRSAGVGLLFAGQRSVIQYTGSKDLHANAGNKIILRVNRAAEMNNIVPGWEADGMPDMSAYGQGARGVALVVGPDGTWTAGRVADMSDLDAVQALAIRRGKPAAALPPAIAGKLPGYAQRHDPATAGAAVITLDRHRASQPSPVTRLASLPAAVAGQLTGMPAVPGRPTPLADLIAARNAINAAETNTPAANRAIPVPATITSPVLNLLAARGDAGARRDEIVAAIGKSRSAVASWLAIMRDHGLITATGAGKAARYHLPEHAPDTDEPEQDPADDVA